MEITNFIERDNVEKYRQLIEDFQEVLEWEISSYTDIKIVEVLNTLYQIDNELYWKLKRFSVNSETNSKIHFAK